LNLLAPLPEFVLGQRRVAHLAGVEIDVAAVTLSIGGIRRKRRDLATGTAVDVAQESKNVVRRRPTYRSLPGAVSVNVRPLGDGFLNRRVESVDAGTILADLLNGST
jgi:hypothetical protein